MLHQVPRRPSTCTPTSQRNAEFLADAPNIYGTLCDYGCERPPSNPSYSDSSSPSMKTLYDYFRGRRPMYNYRRRGRLLPLLPLRTQTAPRMHLEGITAETMTHGRKHVLYEMLMFESCPSCHYTFLLGCHAVDPWETRLPGSPHHLARHAPAHFPFASVSQSSYQKPICCRGITFGFVVVAPLSFL